MRHRRPVSVTQLSTVILEELLCFWQGSGYRKQSAPLLQVWSPQSTQDTAVICSHKMEVSPLLVAKQQNDCLHEMEEKNITMITGVRIIGFQIIQGMKYWVFFFFLMIYCVTICGNLLIITVVSFSKTLQFPMYFFLSQLSLSDILLATDILPNFLNSVLVKDTIMPFSSCITQFYFFNVSETIECLLLTVMSYDRYLAICKPLHYTMIMSHQICWLTIVTSWILSFLIVLIHTLTVSQLQFCGPNVVDHFFCDFDPFLKLSCSDTSIVQLEVTALSVVFVVIPFFIIIVSYIYIIVTILEIPSISGRKKAFSTCSSHLSAVSLYYGTLVCVYLVPTREQSWNMTKFLSLLYTVVTPLMNPVIYSLRNRDLKDAAGKLVVQVLISKWNRA
ncbi:olfactory receptor 1468-like [Gastrophryne carolinensis]